MRNLRRIMFIMSVCILLVISCFISCSRKKMKNQYDLTWLEEKLNNAEGENRIKILNKIAYIKSSYDHDGALKYVEEAEGFLKKIAYKNGVADCFNNKGLINIRKGNLEHAKKCYEFGFKESRKEKYKAGMAEAYNGLGRYYQMIGKYNESMFYYLTSLDVCEKNEDDNQIALANCYHGLAVLHFYDQGFYDYALEYCKKSLKIRKKIGELNDIAYSYYSLGEVYQNKGDLRAARKYLKECQRRNASLKSKYIEANIYQAKGDICKKEKNFSDAKKYYFKSLALFNKIEDKFQISRTYHAIGDYYSHIEVQKYQKSIYYLEKAREIAKELNNTDTKKLIAESFLVAYKGLLKKENKEKFQIEYIEKMKEFQKEYDNCKKKLEKNRMHKITKYYGMLIKEEKDKAIKQFLFISLASALLLLTVIIIAFIKKQKYNNKLYQQKISIEKKNQLLEQQKEALEKSHNDLKMLNEIGKIIISSLSEKKIYNLVYDCIKEKELMDAAVFWIYRYDEQSKKLILIGGKEIGLEDSSHDIELTEKKRAAVRCFLGEETIKFGDYQHEYQERYKEPAPPQIKGKTYNSHIFLPLIIESKNKNENIGKKKIGVITVQSARKNAYTDYHVNILKNIGGYAAIAVDNANAYQQIDIKNKKIDEQRKKLEDVLKKKTEPKKEYRTNKGKERKKNIE